MRKNKIEDTKKDTNNYGHRIFVKDKKLKKKHTEEKTTTSVNGAWKTGWS